MSEPAENPFPEDWADASDEVLFDACIAAQGVLQDNLTKLGGFYVGYRKIQAEAARRGVRYPDMLTAEDKARLTFIVQNPLQN